MLFRWLLAATCFAFTLAVDPEAATLTPFARDHVCGKCAREGQPQCTVRNGVFRMFPHNCARMTHYCKTGEDWEVIRMSNCAHTICPLRCSNEGPSVCASDGSVYRLFRTECTFMNFACANYKEEWSTVLNCIMVGTDILLE